MKTEQSQDTASKQPDSEPNWKAVASDCLNALRLMNAHYNDISKSNPGFMGKLCLQRYDLWNTALLESEVTLQKYAHIQQPAPVPDKNTE